MRHWLIMTIRRRMSQSLIEVLLLSGKEIIHDTTYCIPCARASPDSDYILTLTRHFMEGILF